MSELRGDLGRKDDQGETLLLDGKGTLLENEMSMEDDSKLLVHEQTYNDVFASSKYKKKKPEQKPEKPPERIEMHKTNLNPSSRYESSQFSNYNEGYQLSERSFLNSNDKSPFSEPT